MLDPDLLNGCIFTLRLLGVCFAVLSAELFSFPLTLVNASRAALSPAVGLATPVSTIKRSTFLVHLSCKA